ncbi:MAG: PKD domain-containing protein [Thermoplasmata archaeon]|nr:MAG: PKD domain-containing protein [Thermoplasmata archaeon]
MRRIFGIIIVIIILLSTINVSASNEEDDNHSNVSHSPLIITDEPNQNDSNQTYFNMPIETGSRAFIVPPYEVQDAIKHIIDTVTEDHLKTFLDKLVGFDSRYYYAPGMYSASEWLYNVLDGHGRLKMEYHNFSLTTSEGSFLLSNVILTLPGLDEDSNRTFYMFAHSDAIQSDKPEQLLTNTPGANDDGTGCAAVLEAARVLSYYDFKDTIKFAFFNAEELGSLGSERYAKNMSDRNENVIASINYDMIGYSQSSTQHNLKFYYNTASNEQEKYLEGVNSRYNIGITITSQKMSSDLPSDIQSFYDYGYPCVLGNDADNYPYYHSTEDTIDKINFALVEKSTRLAVASFAEWARLLYVDVSIPPGNLKASNTKPNEDDLVNITVNVTNSGNLNAANLEVAFYADGKKFASNRITVPSSGSNSTSVYWQAADGSHDISVVLDPNNEIIESDETNNEASITVSVNDRPRAVLNAYPTTAFTTEIITFNGSLSWDDIGGISGFLFNFGDGNSTDWVINPTITHAYSRSGSYTASLLVKDPDGAISKPYYLELYIKNQAPLATPSSNLTYALTFVPIQFYSNAVDIDGTVTVHWTFGDGSESTEPNPIHQYSKSGSYDVLLKIQDDDDATTSYLMRIIIENRPPICSIDVNLITGNITTNFIFTANATDPDGSIYSYKWDFGDGFSSTMQTSNHYFMIPGTYIVLLSVRDDEDYETRTYIEVIIIDTPPVATGWAFPTNPLTFEKVSFNGEKSYDNEGSVSFLWNFGDGNRSSEASPVHMYMEPGIYPVNLTVMDFTGQINTVDIIKINVGNRPPVANFRIFGELTENCIVYFDGTQSNDPEGELSFSWDFGDGTNGSGPLIEHIYSKPGKYYVNLTVTDESGESEKIQQSVTINSAQSDETVPKDQGEESSGKSLLIFILIAMNIFWIILFIVMFQRIKNRKKKASIEISNSENEKPPLETSPTPRLNEGQFPPTRSSLGDSTVYPAAPQVSPQIFPTGRMDSKEATYITSPQDPFMQLPTEPPQQLQLEPEKETRGEDATKPPFPDNSEVEIIKKTKPIDPKIFN